ncbi:hypothetical protein [Krasilnikovia sp. M28-CT-15]|uniref:hypothetical protein n=1 Tax=Krasilnikovia sp. M28-CT-15 TaxID=3373540 RepID=UPI00399C7CBF
MTTLPAAWQQPPDDGRSSRSRMNTVVLAVFSVLVFCYACFCCGGVALAVILSDNKPDVDVTTPAEPSPSTAIPAAKGTERANATAASPPVTTPPVTTPPVPNLPGDGIDNNNGGGNCWWVNGYTRRDGTYVRGHTACRRDGVDNNNGGGNCWWVNGYTRRDGTYVRGHTACRH